MKRFIPGLVFVGLMVAALATIAYVVVKSLTRPPLSYEELVTLQDEGDRAAPEIPRIVACFDYNDEIICAQAAETLSKIGPKAVDPLRAKLKSNNAKTRFWAVQTLALLGPDAKDAADDLVPRLKDDDASVRYKTVYALGKLGVQSEPILAGLVNALTDKDDAVRTTAIEVLDKMPTPPKDSLPMLAKLAATSGEPDAVRHAAIKLLGRLGEPAVPTFRELLKDAKEGDRQRVIEAILQLGPDATELVPQLVLILTQQVRGPGSDPTLVQILMKCDAAGAKGLAEILKAVEGETVAWASRLTLYQAVGELRSPAAAKASVPILVALLQSEKSKVDRQQILETLGAIGVPARDAIPVVEMLTSDPQVGEAARVALRRMGKLEAKTN